MTNKKRAETARQVLCHFAELKSGDDDIETLSVDLIADICHLLSGMGVDPSDIFRRALFHFDCEHPQEGRPSKQHGGE